MMKKVVNFIIILSLLVVLVTPTTSLAKSKTLQDYKNEVAKLENQ